MAERRISLSRVTGPADDPVSLADVKTHLRLTTAGEDALLADWITAASETLDLQTDRAWLTQRWRLTLDGFPKDRDPIWIPKPPLQTVHSVTYVDATGATQTWAADRYRVVAPAGPTAPKGYVLPITTADYPTAIADGRPDVVTVEFTCGFTSTAAVPARVRAALRLLVAYLSTHRGDTDQAVPETLRWLLAPYELVEV